MTQLEAIKSVRKPATPPTKVIRPKKGGGYRRREKGKRYSPFDDSIEYHESFV